LKGILVFIFSIISFTSTAIELNINKYSYPNINDWDKVISIPTGAIVLSNSTNKIIFETWQLTDLLSTDNGYTDSLKKRSPIYFAKDFVNCAVKIDCKTTSLKKIASTLPSYTDMPNLAIDACTKKNILCYIFPSKIPSYKYEAFIYANNANDYYFLRVYGDQKNKENFQKILNNLSIKRN